MNVFDIIGPVMIGPSSSHTAGAVRLGRVAWKILGEDVAQADIQLAGSFAQTYRGHGTDKALIAGIMGMHSDDERIRRSLELARERGLAFSFREEDIPGAHPNTAPKKPSAPHLTAAWAMASLPFISVTSCCAIELNPPFFSYKPLYIRRDRLFRTTHNRCSRPDSPPRRTDNHAHSPSCVPKQ